MQPRNPRDPNFFLPGQLRKRLTQYGQKFTEEAPMGCDIHWHSETLKDGRWECDQAESFQLDADANDEQDEDAELRYDMDDLPGRGRDYWLFGLLCNGVRTHWPFAFNEKGHPDDLSHEVQTIANQWDGDGHSHSWLTREELLAKKTELEALRPVLLISDHAEYSMVNVDSLIQSLATTIGHMEAASPGAAPEEQRVVFWFDN